jgi:hypothetical protein
VQHVATPPGHGHRRHVGKESIEELHRYVVDIIAWLTISTRTTESLPPHEKKEKDGAAGDDPQEHGDAKILKEGIFLFCWW